MPKAGKYTVNMGNKSKFIVIEKGDYKNYAGDISKLNDSINKIENLLRSSAYENYSPDTLAELKLYKEYIAHIMSNEVSKEEVVKVKNFIETMADQSSNTFKTLSKIKESDDILNWFVNSATPIAIYLSDLIN